MFRSRFLGLLCLCLLLAGLQGCSDHRKKVRSEVPHSGYRSDAPSAAKRGNGQFGEASFDPTGRWLLATVTFAGLHLWRASDGKFIGGLNGMHVEGWHFTPDGEGVMMQFDKRPGYHLVSLPSGDVLASIAQERKENEQRLAGLTPDGSLAVVFTKDALEFWSLKSGRLEATLLAPWQSSPGGSRCTIFGGSYFRTQCVVFSPDGNWLALAYADGGGIRDRTHYYLVDLRQREFIRIDVPDFASVATAGLLFSPDSRTLAIGVSKGLLFFDMESRSLSPLLAGQHERNQFLAPAAFSTPTTLVAMADQLEVNIIDASASDRKIVRRVFHGKYWEGVFRVSRNGARVVLYHSRGDVLQVLDGRTGERVGWVCPYFCNRPRFDIIDYAVSPNGLAVAASHDAGAAIWSTDNDTLLAPLFNPNLGPLKD